MKLPSSLICFPRFPSLSTVYNVPDALRRIRTRFLGEKARVDIQTDRKAHVESVAARLSRKDLEHAFAETMWKMKVMQDDPKFLATRPEKLQTLFHSCQNSVHVAPSSIPAAKKGLFASQDNGIPAGSIFTFYPMHALGVKFPDESCFLFGEKGYDHTKSAYILSLIGNRRILVGNIDLQNDFGGIGFVDADPTRSVQKAWQCHIINDSATIQRNAPESVKEYYQASLEKQNAIYMPIGPAPLHAAMATKDIPKGEEIFTCYGRSYWLGLLEPDTDLWSSLTDEIACTEKTIEGVIEEASDWISTEYAQEEAELFRAFHDID